MSIERATDATHGPFRAVVSVEPALSLYGKVARQEILECGHPGRRLFHEFMRPAKRRRCWSCR